MAKDTNSFAAESASPLTGSMKTATRQTPADALPGFQSITVPLSKLFVSVRNVRTSQNTAPKEHSAASIAQMAAMLQAQGPINPLNIEAETKDGKHTGRFGVVAGGRRYLGFMLLAKRGTIGEDHPIECRLGEAGRATQISLTENLAQEPMHPADEFAGFQKMVLEGLTANEIAARFGLSVIHVQRRLALANVAPELVQRYRQGELTGEVMTAFAAVPDKARQLEVFNRLNDWQRKNPHIIKNELRADEISAADERVKFVGLDAYKDAGGEVCTDLFSEAKDSYLADPLLLSMLLADKMEAERVAVLEGEGWAWVDCHEEFSGAVRAEYKFLPKRKLPDTPEYLAQLEALTQAYDEAQGVVESCNEDEEQGENVQDAAENALTACGESLEKLKASRIDPNAYDKTTTGAVLHLQNGVIQVARGLVRMADLPALVKKMTDDGNAEGAVLLAGHANAGSGAKEKADIPAKLMQNLTAQRTAAIQAEMLTHQRVALAMLAVRLCNDLAHGHKPSLLQISVTNSRYELEKHSPTLQSSPAAAVMAQEREALQEILPESQDDWFAWLMKQGPEMTLRLLTFGVAQTVNTVQAEGERSTDTSQLMAALDLNMSAYWQPTPDNYLNLVPKSKMTEAVTQAKGATAAADIAKLKKAEAIAHADAMLSGTNWLPKPLQAAPSIWNPAA